MQAYWLVGRVLLTPPAEAAASQKWKIIYLQVLRLRPLRLRSGQACGLHLTTDYADISICLTKDQLL